MQIDYGSTADEDDDDKKPAAAKKKKLEEEASTLGAGVQGLMKLIGSKEAMNLAMKELEVDTTRMPLGKISKDQIKKAYGCLTAIETELKKKSPNVQEQTDLFYTLIPHDFGFRKPPLINSDAMLKAKIEMLETLSGLEIASKLLDNAEAAQGTTRVKNHLDRTYDSLHCKIEELDEKDPVFDAVKTYVKNTKGATHRLYQLEVEKVFSIEREGESSRYTTHYGKVGNKRMLWHGSRMTNFVGILSNGLRIAPPEAPVTGYMFGKGIYFSDVSSKSANYCNTTRTSNTGLMLLCEVALGEQKEYVQASYVTKLPAPYQSTKGVGQMFPDPKGEITVGGETDVIWPVGKMTKDDEDKRNLALLYPEHIVYDVNQCRMRYLVQLKFKYN
ncbi:Poly(ADP-ribose) polymerase, regulatory domain/Poly(ADP-ribose) polymerase catalytic domain containing protein, putative [Angomonas deanei]|uniref:Poly [ADP-ribose] polymerase n=1 Tax=Angomonas deanei TaxID=59799 RepID=A0A7G2CQ48_9TRYP|nr:Poly(ADP-ribose) polymerase, regulatory domain/Poly(ADP-ribose) polymerase catalytic domain containing protein, putative [Angomonas deanei]